MGMMVTVGGGEDEESDDEEGDDEESEDNGKEQEEGESGIELSPPPCKRKHPAEPLKGSAAT